MSADRIKKCHRFSSVIVRLWMILTIFSFSSLQASTTPKFSKMMYYVGLMVLDPGVSINEILNQDDYVVMKGVAPDQRTAYLLAEKLFHSRMQKEFHFEDVVPFWKKNGFTFILKKPKANDRKSALEIKSPLVRNFLEAKFTLEGVCTKDGAELVLSGDFNGTTTCKKGTWSIDLSAQATKLPIVGVKVSQGIRGYQDKDFRSFLIK